MKQLFLLLIALVTLNAGVAQQNYCGTVTTQQFHDEHVARVARYTDYQGQRAGKLYVPIFYHLIGKADKTGLMRMSDILQSHCELNAAYELSNIYFYIVGFDTIYNDSYYSFSNYSTGNDIMDIHNMSGLCNVYINNSPAGNCGYAFFPNSRFNDGIFINKGCHGPKSSTLMHEMGHYLGLPHTFENWGGVEFVNGSNCASAGDFFCDTPADFIDYRWTCPYNGNETDPNGDLYRTVLDGSFYMSYSNDACQNKFSPLQRNHTYQTLQNERTVLLANQPATIPTHDTVIKMLPLSGDTAVNAKGVLFKWRAVPGATHYIFQMPTAVSGFFTLDSILSDTAIYFSRLNPNFLYRWRVRAFSYLNTCSEFSSVFTFRTSSVRVVPQVTGSTCAGSDNAVVQLDVTGGTAPYSYLWSNGDTTATLTGLAAGQYSYTVTDADGEVVNGIATVGNGNLLSGSLAFAAGTITANVSGGIAPYSYAWSDGSTGNTLQPVSSGTYTVTVTDANQCQITAAYTYSSVGISEVESAAVSIAPNPVEEEKITITTDEAYSAISVTITDVMGNIVFRNERLPLTYKRATLDRPAHTAAGLYVFIVKTGEKTAVKRIVFK